MVSGSSSLSAAAAAPPIPPVPSLEPPESVTEVSSSSFAGASGAVVVADVSVGSGGAPDFGAFMATLQAQFTALQVTITAAVAPLQQALEDQRQLHHSLELRLRTVMEDVAVLKGDASLARRAAARVSPDVPRLLSRTRARSAEPERSSGDEEDPAPSTSGPDVGMPEASQVADAAAAAARRRVGKQGRVSPPTQ